MLPGGARGVAGADLKRQLRVLGNSRVLMSTSAPLKSPCRSGVKVLLVVMVCSRPAGNMSSGTTRRSGSGLGTRAPLSELVV